jgi:cell division transport system permease protein
MVTLMRDDRSAKPQKRGEDALRPLKRDMPLVPSDSIAGRALVTVIAIMTFLAALTAGVAMLIADASHDWQSDVSREMTIQVRPTPGQDLDELTQQAATIARATPGIKAVDPYSKAESEKLLQPWLGSGLDLGDLPVPRLIVVKLDPDHGLDLSALRRALEDKVPGVSVDDHRIWLARLATMAHATVAIGLVVFGLVLTAMLLAVAFATRGAMAGNKEIIEILHFVGAADSFISRQFQRHFLRLGLRGGAIGGGIAILFFLLGGRALGVWRTTAGGEQIEAMFGTFSLHLRGYVAILVITASIALLTGIVSRLIVYRHLRSMM